MPDISASQVQSLRSRTDLPLMDCKRALIETGGDEEKAIALLREKFKDKMSSRADKEAANGRIGLYADVKGGALAELRCETDFVASNSVFVELANLTAHQAAETHLKEPEALMGSKAAFAGGRTIKELMADAYGKLNEKMEIRRARCAHGAAAGYVHHNGKVAALVTMDKPNDAAGRQVCMHIASAQTLLGLDRAVIDPALVEEARAAATAEVANKPPQIIEKIVAGKIDKWFAERVLLEQPFALDDKKTVGAFAKENGITITGYLRYELGGKD